MYTLTHTCTHSSTLWAMHTRMYTLTHTHILCTFVPGMLSHRHVFTQNTETHRDTHTHRHSYEPGIHHFKPEWSIGRGTGFIIGSILSFLPIRKCWHWV